MAEQEKNIVLQFEEQARYMDRTVDKGFVNTETGGSIGLRANGDAVIAASEEAQYKLNKANNSAVEITHQSTTITNRKEILADEIIINGHKLNPDLYELSDFRQMAGTAIGGLNMMGTVLVRAWEPNLKRYVLIRRFMQTPMFSNKLGAPNIPNNMNVDGNISDVINQYSEVTE
jgi:hypothetical protein